MAFRLLPAIDVAGGRLAPRSDDRSDSEAAPSDPRRAALAFQGDGAEWIHRVDLDAAFRRGSNAELLRHLIGELDVQVELAGGIRDHTALDRAVATGCSRVVVAAGHDDGAFCAQAIDAHGDRVAIGLEVRTGERADGSAAHRLTSRTAGDDGVGGVDLFEAIERLDRAGCARYVVTDVGADGTMGGPNVDLYRSIGRVTSTPVIASGGIGTVDDLVELARAATSGLPIEGSIVGAALHTGRFTVHDAVAAIRRAETAG